MPIPRPWTEGLNVLGPASISDKTSYCKISQRLEAARFVFRTVQSPWNLTGTTAAVLQMCLSNFKTIRKSKLPISWLRDFRSYDKTSYQILKRCSGRYYPNALRHQNPISTTAIKKATGSAIQRLGVFFLAWSKLSDKKSSHR